MNGGVHVEPSFKPEWIQHVLELTRDTRRSELIRLMTKQLAQLTKDDRSALIVQLLERRMAESNIDRIVELRMREPMRPFPMIYRLLMQFDEVYLQQLAAAQAAPSVQVGLL